MKQERIKQGVSVQAIANAAGVSVSTYRRWENLRGDSSPNGREIVDVCTFLKISPSWALLGVGPVYLQELDLAHALMRTFTAVGTLSTIADDLEKKLSRLQAIIDAMPKGPNNNRG